MNSEYESQYYVTTDCPRCTGACSLASTTTSSPTVNPTAFPTIHSNSTSSSKSSTSSSLSSGAKIAVIVCSIVGGIAIIGCIIYFAMAKSVASTVAVGYSNTVTANKQVQLV